METIYNVDYFIAKFSAIPESLYIVFERHAGDKHCAHGWCDLRQTNGFGGFSEEEIALKTLAKTLSSPRYPLEGFATINNGSHPDYQQATPKQRILAALRDIKAKQDIDTGNKTEVKERIVYVTVDKDVRELQQKELVTN